MAPGVAGGKPPDRPGAASSDSGAVAAIVAAMVRFHSAAARSTGPSLSTEGDGRTSALADRTRTLLLAPVLPTLMRLAAPSLGEAAARVTFLTADAIFVSWLGGDALAAVAIVFPFLLVIQTATASGFGAGVASSIGHALGAGQRERARRLAGTAVALALVAAVATTGLLLVLGPTLYQSMGARGAVLLMANRYGVAIFGGIGFIWLMNILANISRGSGNTVWPAVAIFAGECCHLLLSPALIFGWGFVPRLGILGAALGALSAYGVGSAVLSCHLFSKRALTRLDLRLIRISGAAACSVLKVGAPAAASVCAFWSVNVLTLALIGGLGRSTIAAYGVATRLDTIQYPIIFAIAAAVVTMVATAHGAGDQLRASHVARTGCAVAAMVALVFTMIALSGDAWMGLFTRDPVIRATGALYLRLQALTYPIFAAGIVTVMACYGVGMVRLPLVVNLARLAIGVGGGWIAFAFHKQAWPVFLTLAFGASVYGLAMMLALHRRFGSSDRRTSESPR
jgi:putative MATE family efflux protein